MTKGGKTIFIKDSAMNILKEQQQILRENGLDRPSYTDAIRYLNGEISVKIRKED